MNKDNETSIHEFDFNLICEYFSSIDRQGPGSESMTGKALSYVGELYADSRIADLGCGTGGQTVTIAKEVPGHIYALDLFPTFIDRLNARVVSNGLSERIDGIVGSMDALPFKEETFDLIWSEGAIYNIGFRKGLEYWRKFLKPGGIVCVSEASWLSESRPSEIEDFWMDAYPEIDTVEHKVRQMKEIGYDVITSFVIPENCWTEHFYKPQRKAQKIFLQNHQENPIASELVANMRHEAALYSKYSKYYGYVFYIGKKD